MYLLSISSSVTTPGATISPCVRKNSWVILYPESEITLKNGNMRRRVKSSHIYISNNCTIINEAKNCVKINIAFFCSSHVKSYHSDFFEALPFDLTNSLVNSFQATLNNADLKSIKLLNDLFDDYIHMKYQYKVKPVKKKIDSRLIRVHRIIRTRYSEQLSLTYIAEQIQCNPVYLSNTYSKVFKISPMKHLQNIRIGNARILLETTDFSILKITALVGYISTSQFSTYFKKHVGISPTEYRRLSKKNERKGGIGC